MSVTIKDGFDNKPCHITIDTQSNGSIQLWIKNEGIEGRFEEILIHVTPDELLKLHQEVKRAAKDLFNI